MKPPVERHAINFAWLIRLRWGSVAGQLVTILAVSRFMGIGLPLVALGVVIAVEAASNVLCLAAARAATVERPVREWWLVVVMALDTLVLTALLFLSGGPMNPFSFLYLVQIALAAVILRERWTWLLVVLAVAGSGVLFAAHRPLAMGGNHAEHMSFHLRGMWVAFVVAAAFIVYFLMRVNRALADREVDLQAARTRAAQQEKLASLATLAAGAAHELSTPLGTIALAARELERQLGPDAPAALAEDVALIRSQVQRCRSILERMAADAGESAGEAPESVAVRQLLDGALVGLGRAEAVRVQLDPSLDGVEVRMPPRAVAQALRGLLKNALDASPPEATVALRAFTLGASGDAAGSSVAGRSSAHHGVGTLCVEVRDEGAGMSPEVLAKVGEPFFTTKAPGQGMGLGVFLSRALMQRLGGELRFESAASRGTTATVRLPLAIAERADDTERTANILRMPAGART